MTRPLVMRWLRYGLLALLLVLFAGVSMRLDVGALFAQARASFEALGAFGPLLFALAYGALGALAVPNGLLDVLAGALFGFWAGGAAVLGGALMAANLGFLIGAWLARDWVAARLAGRRTAAQIQAAVAQRGFWITVLIRLSPAVPFNITNYVLGASAMAWGPFVAATALGMLPIKLLLVWLGASGQQLLAARHPAGWGLNEWLVYGGGALASLALVLLIGRIVAGISREALRRAEQEH